MSTWAKRRAAAVEAAALALIADPSVPEAERRRAKLELAGAITEDGARWRDALASLTPAELATLRSVLARMVPRVGGRGLDEVFEREAARRELAPELAD